MRLGSQAVVGSKDGGLRILSQPLSASLLRPSPRCDETSTVVCQEEEDVWETLSNGPFVRQHKARMTGTIARPVFRFLRVRREMTRCRNNADDPQEQECSVNAFGPIKNKQRHIPLSPRPASAKLVNIQIVSVPPNALITRCAESNTSLLRRSLRCSSKAVPQELSTLSYKNNQSAKLTSKRHLLDARLVHSTKKNDFSLLNRRRCLPDGDSTSTGHQ